MKSPEQPSPNGVLYHCYQNTVNGFLLFYTVGDHLVYYTILCTTAQKYPVRILSLCLMPDHIHMAVVVQDKMVLSRFIGECTRNYSTAHNQRFRESGNLFNSPYGCAPKTEAKRARSLLVYIGNNPVERKLTKEAEAYRWNFLAYAASSHPFSEKLELKSASNPMRKAIREVQAQHKTGKPLSYMLLDRLFNTLDTDEKQQLTDYIIRCYCVIDFQGAARFFDSIQDMLAAMHATTGNEFDLTEVRVGRSDKWYLTLTKLLLSNGQVSHIHQLFSWPVQQRKDLFRYLLDHTSCPPVQVAKYLHLAR